MRYVVHSRRAERTAVGQDAPMELRRFRANEGPLFREVRLRALRDAPSAFDATYADAAVRPAPFWDEWIAKWAAGERQVGFVALDGARATGLVGGYFDDDEGEPDAVHLIAMWVAPEARGRGVGSALTTAVVDWARERGARRVKLWVARSNREAIRLYERCGFRHTGVGMTLSHDDIQAERMERAP
jgi:ribosomal protein S18 acetylase RimI-like enzyme